MRFTAHPERRTAFEKAVEELGLIHGKCRPRSPWQNGIIERSHRTDNEGLFNQMRFADSEERRYMLKLWEYHYNCERPHQGIGCRTPMEVYLSDYHLHAGSRMLGNVH